MVFLAGCLLGIISALCLLCADYAGQTQIGKIALWSAGASVVLMFGCWFYVIFS